MVISIATMSTCLPARTSPRTLCRTAAQETNRRRHRNQLAWSISLLPRAVLCVLFDALRHIVFDSTAMHKALWRNSLKEGANASVALGMTAAQRGMGDESCDHLIGSAISFFFGDLYIRHFTSHCNHSCAAAVSKASFFPVVEHFDTLLKVFFKLSFTLL